MGRTRYRLPLDADLARKFDALEALVDVRVLASADRDSGTEDDRFQLVRPLRPRKLDGLAFHLTLPVRVARELRRFPPDAVLAQGPHEAAAVLLARGFARAPTKVIVDVHGDWRTATRLYGSRARRILSPVADAMAALAVRRADGVRTVSDFTSSLVREAGREPTAVFPAFMDLESFNDHGPAPLPERPAILFVGVLERYKAIDVLAEAWRQAAPRVPEAELRIVGTGSRAAVVERLLGDLPAQTSWIERLTHDEIAGELDRATCLVLPSPREGMGRVIIEALCRGRPIVGSRAGGIVDLVRDGESGVLVPPEDPEALAAALVELLSNRAEAARLAQGARASASDWTATPEDWARHMAGLVERMVAG